MQVLKNPAEKILLQPTENHDTLAPDLLLLKTALSSSNVYPHLLSSPCFLYSLALVIPRI